MSIEDYTRILSGGSTSPCQSLAKSTGQLHQLEAEQRQRGQLLARQKSCQASRSPVVRMAPLLSSLSSTLSSTPISSVARNNYKRLVPADEFSHHHQQPQPPVQVSSYPSHNQLAAAHSFASTQHLGAHHHQQSPAAQMSPSQRDYQQIQRRQQQQMTASCYSLNQSRRPHAHQQQQQRQQQHAHFASNSGDLSGQPRQVRRAIFVSPIAPPPQQQQQQQQQQHHSRSEAARSSEAHSTGAATLASVFRTSDPVLLEWMRAMRFDAELECLTALQARTLAIDDNLAAALAVRNSQVAIQELRLESDYILDLTDILIGLLPLNLSTLDKFALDFSHLWGLLVRQTEAQTRSSATTSNATTTTTNHCQNNLTIINCTPRKSLASARTLRPLDELANKIRGTCIELANTVNGHQEQASLCATAGDSDAELKPIDNAHLEAGLRRIKELFGKFVEISVRAECASIVRALQFDFTSTHTGTSARPLATSQLENALAADGGGRQGSSASLKPVRVYQASTAQLPLKWALIALWQLTKDDGYICRLLTEMWQTGGGGGAPAEFEQPGAEQPALGRKPCGAAKRLDYSCEGQQQQQQARPLAASNQQHPTKTTTSTRRRCEKPYAEICERFRENQQALLLQQQQQQQQQQRQRALEQARAGALSSALRSKQQQARQLSTIELLIEIIISQPNKHERVDMMNFMQSARLVDVGRGEGAYNNGGGGFYEDENERASAALYTSNQYKVAALRILNHLCINEQAVKTILRCFSTPPPRPGQPLPQNKIIRSIFECYQTAQEHIYQNETMFSRRRRRGPQALQKHKQQQQQQRARSLRKRARHSQAAAQADHEEFSDYGSRQTNSVPTSDSLASDLELAAHNQLACEEDDAGAEADVDANEGETDEEGEDAVVKEALRLLVQLTTPFHRSNQGHDFYTLIGRFSVESLVRYLSQIIKSATSRDMVLLALSALANVSFITTEPMKAAGTSQAILDMFQASKARAKDLELRDQTVTILANMADKSGAEMSSSGALLAFLLSCLEVCPTRMANFKLAAEQGEPAQAARHQYARIDGSDSSAESYAACSLAAGGGGGRNSRHQPPFASRIENKQPRDRKPIQVSDEFLDDLDCVCDSQLARQSSAPMVCLARLQPSQLAAMERIHQKTAVAFARLSGDASASRLVLKYGGIKQMIDLCKLSNRRNHSDTVLIACLAALRKMAAVLGPEVFRHYNALDLIELELNQALEIYGSLYASEV